jgi:ferric-dicitrate binding protein FerR (iron transport regulator)
VDAKRKRPVRRLWGNGKGRFTTKGRYSSATVRGTKWLVQDRCDGTLTRVLRGIVLVRDFRARKNVSVRAGRSYLAKAPGA